MGIDNHLKVIKEGVFGRDVRQAIHDGIKQAYDDATTNGNANMEVAKARGKYANLSDRLDKSDNQYTEAISKTNALSSQVVNIVANAGNGTIPTEVIDGRTAFDGRVFSTIGDAIRTQFEGVAVTKTKANILNLAEAVVGQYIDGLTGLKDDNVPLYQYNKIVVYPNQTYYFKFADNVHVAFFDASNRYISGMTNPTSLQAPSNAINMYVSYQTAQKYAFMVSMKPITKYEPFENRIPGTLLADGAVGLSQLSEEVRESIGAIKKIILVGPGQEYTSLLKAIVSNEGTVNEYRLVGYNSNIADEYQDHFGKDYFKNYIGYGDGSTNVQDRGLFLKKGDCIVGDSKSKIRFSYDGSNPIVNEFFAPVNLSVDNTVDNVSFEISDGICRYMIHDDFAMGENGTNIIQNCHFKGTSFLSTAIGGGMATSSTYIVDTCIFENVGFIAVTYHNSAENNALNKYIVKNCYCYEGSVIRGTWYGPSTDITQMIVSGCTADRIICEAAGDVVNMSLLAFNNTVRK